MHRLDSSFDFFTTVGAVQSRAGWGRALRRHGVRWEHRLGVASAWSAAVRLLLREVQLLVWTDRVVALMRLWVWSPHWRHWSGVVSMTSTEASVQILTWS